LQLDSWECGAALFGFNLGSEAMQLLVVITVASMAGIGDRLFALHGITS
jgi:hypothetical protein